MLKISKILVLLLMFNSVGIFSQENNIKNYSFSEGLKSAAIFDINQDNIGYLWLATNKGLVKFDGINFKEYNLHTKSKVNKVLFVNNHLFTAHTSGIFSIKKDSISYLGNEKVNKIIPLNNKILLGTNEGIYQFIDSYIAPLKIHNQIDFSNIYDIKYFENNFYIASNNGLWKINSLINPSKIEKIINDKINSLLVVNDFLSIQLKNKILFYKNQKIDSKINIDALITSTSVINNKLWITTNGDGIHLYNITDLSFERKINKYNSTISNNINIVYKDKQNIIWIGSNDSGLFSYSSVKKISKPKVFLENIYINYKKQKFSKNDKLELKPSENNISISFKTVDLQNEKNIQYQYQLNNQISPWSYQNKIDFATLKSGLYKFKIQSKVNDNLSNIEEFTFNIAKPLYKEIWFLISCGIFICLLFYFLIDQHIKKINKKNNQKVASLKLENHLLTLEQKALQLQMNPHFIFNVLNGIKALGNSGNSVELNKTISQFSILLRSILNNSRLEEINLQEETNTLKTYLELEQKMSSKPFDYHIQSNLNNIDAEEILIPPMLIQPFVENCIKHAFHSKVTNAQIDILFEAKNKFLYFNIKDNGIGYHHSNKNKNESEHKSIALKITKERIQHLSKFNSFKIEEIIEEKEIKGTMVTFKIPLKTDF